jgi:glycosyltransferase involved in cell wall biosynthesis
MTEWVAVICSVLNEGSAIDVLLDSLLAQTRRPDEIVVADGGSRDDTVARIRRRVEAGASIRVIERPGSNISQARNAAIGETSAPIVAVTDCGVRLEPDWLERLTAPFGQPEPPDVVAGFFRPDPSGAFETALGATTLIAAEDVDPEQFLPSSRSVAFRRSAWVEVGGYPEWLDHSEDVLFDLRLKAHGFRFAFEPRALVHFQPRQSASSFARQYYQYARGDGRADLWRKRHAIRYATYAGAPLVLVGGLKWRRLWLAGLVAFGAYLRTPYRRLWPWLPSLTPRQRVEAIAWVPAIRVIGDVAKIVGYPVGVWRRLRAGERIA